MRLNPTLKILLLTLVTFVTSLALAQPAPKVEWSAKLNRETVRAGESAQIIVTGKIQEGWHIYSGQLQGEWISLSGRLEEGQPLLPDGDGKPGEALKFLEPEGIKKYDRGFKANVITFEGEIVVAMPVKVAPNATGNQVASLIIRSQACDARSCDPPARATLEIPFTVEPGPANPEFLAAQTDVPPQTSNYVPPRDETALASDAQADTPSVPSGAGAVPTDDTVKAINQARDQGLIPFLGLSFVAGLLALLTPCVWPMIPITVSFFTKGQGAVSTTDGKKKTNLTGALAYCLGIIGTFVGLGVVVTAIFSAAGIQALAAHPVVNGLLALLFIALALNLFGVYELAVPQAWVGKVQKASNQQSLIGPILMGLVFSLTTFTCTVPFVGTLLATAAATNDWLFPVLGMGAFSLAFAIPFFALALLPQYMTKLPKAGGWLVSVKAYMGFLELAAAVKFISNVDLTLQLGWITREVFLALWVAIIAAATAYLFGWFRLPKETDVKIGPARMAIAFVNVAIVVFLLGAIPGNSRLGNLAGFLPPNPYPGRQAAAGAIAWQHKVEEAQTKARAEGKLIFVNFTGVTCTNCRVMEGEVFPTPEVRKRIESMVPLELYTDRDLAEDRANAALREKLTKSSTNPVYVIMTPDMQVLDIFQGMSLSNQEFITWLDRGTAKGASLN
ncbi:MAG: DUF255 domain-containing protein [Fimbriimonadaceae bacterium]|jgi:thiol:disulfide interchange protein DsbD|nr:DUF255 domain-containing protein [Fimbriimonadaceae bacterium]